MVGTVLDENADAVCATVEIKKLHANSHCQTLRSNVEAVESTKLLLALSGRGLPFASDCEKRIACPACEFDGRIRCEIERGHAAMIPDS